MPFIPEETLREIREKVGILQVISPFVRLKKVGANYVGLCPFHQEKTPSFTVHEGKGIFHCFGCGRGGNIFTFLMAQSNMSFPEAAEDLARRAGVRLPTRVSSREETSIREERERLRSAAERARTYFQQVLRNGSEGKEAREYLTSRGIQENVISTHGIGYAPNRWDGLVDALKKEKSDLSLAEKAGLIIRKAGGGHYDRFRNRIIFPVHDLSGRVVGFGGRALGGEEPKYLNSPESPLYSKGKVLFGLHLAREHMMKENSAVIVEGYFDALALHAHGIKNSVATMGTALTSDHGALLKRFAKTVILVFDPDEGGKRAAERSLSVFLDREMEARIILLPEGQDPDTFLERNGREEFLVRIHGAQPLADFVVEEHRRRSGNTPRGKAQAVDDLLSMMAFMKSPVEKDLFIKKISEVFGVNEESVRESARRPASSRTLSPDAGRERTYPRAEEMLLQLMVGHPEAIRRVRESGALSYVTHPAVKDLGERLVAEFERQPGSFAPEDMMNVLEDEEQRNLFSKFAVHGMDAGDDLWEKMLDDTIEFFDRRNAKGQKLAFQQELKKAEAEGDTARVEYLLRQKAERAKK